MNYLVFIYSHMIVDLLPLVVNMATITETLYNGKEWIRVTSEEILNSQGKPTGHYKEIDREYVSKFGIFDDLEVLKMGTDMINNFKSTHRHDFYLLYGEEYHYIYRVYSYSEVYASFGEAVIKTLETIGLPQGIYDTELADGTPCILIPMKQRQPEREFNLYIIAADPLVTHTP